MEWKDLGDMAIEVGKSVTVLGTIVVATAVVKTVFEWLFALV